MILTRFVSVDFSRTVYLLWLFSCFIKYSPRRDSGKIVAEYVLVVYTKLEWHLVQESFVFMNTDGRI